MPTTTNFGWTTPADTDLVKDGAAAIRTLAGNIDTSLVDLKGGTTGQYLQKNSGTDLDYVWANVSAGGMTLISTTTMTGASVTISSIPATYNDLQIIVQAFKPATDSQAFSMRVNGDSGANRYRGSLTWSDAGADNITFDSTKWDIDQRGTDNTTATGLYYFTIPNYANTTTWKIITGLGFSQNFTTTTNFNHGTFRSVYNQTAAISSLTFFPNSGNFTSGTILLYGVK
jgi:hypothetical protein